MRITRIDFEGPSGNYATAVRRPNSDQIDVTIGWLGRPTGRHHHMQADCEEDIFSMAECLQHHLDGHRPGQDCEQRVAGADASPLRRPRIDPGQASHDAAIGLRGGPRRCNVTPVSFFSEERCDEEERSEGRRRVHRQGIAQAGARADRRHQGDWLVRDQSGHGQHDLHQVGPAAAGQMHGGRSGGPWAADAQAAEEGGDKGQHVAHGGHWGEVGQKGAPTAATGAKSAKKATKGATRAKGRNTGQTGAKVAKPKRISGLTAAFMVLVDADAELSAGAIVEKAAQKGWWKSDAATPAATIYAAGHNLRRHDSRDRHQGREVPIRARREARDLPGPLHARAEARTFQQEGVGHQPSNILPLRSPAWSGFSYGRNRT